VFSDLSYSSVYFRISVGVDFFQKLEDLSCVIPEGRMTGRRR
jgi:hypothetical protein